MAKKEDNGNALKILMFKPLRKRSLEILGHRREGDIKMDIEKVHVNMNLKIKIYKTIILPFVMNESVRWVFVLRLRYLGKNPIVNVCIAEFGEEIKPILH